MHIEHIKQREETEMNLHQKLLHAIVEYDKQQSTRPGYSIYALPLMLEALQSADVFFEQGKDVRAVLCGHFTGRLLARLLKTAGCSPMTKEDALGGWVRRTNY